MGLSKWNLFVKKIYHEGRAKDNSYKFQQALKDASKRKSEMGSLSSTKKHYKNKKGGKSKKHRKKSNRRH